MASLAFLVEFKVLGGRARSAYSVWNLWGLRGGSQKLLVEHTNEARRKRWVHLAGFENRT